MKALLAIILLSLTGVLHAQEESTKPIPAADPKALPAEPLLKRAPAFSEWTIYYTYRKAPVAGSSHADTKDPGAPARAIDPSKFAKIVVSKTGPIVRTVIFYQGGHKTDAWSNGELQASMKPGNSVYSVGGLVTAVADAPFDLNDPLNIDYRKADFQDLDWISIQNFIGRKQQYLVFQDSASSRIAYIDDETRLPVRLQSGLETRDYQIQELPHTMQTFPPEAQRAVEELKRKIKTYTSWGARP